MTDKNDSGDIVLDGSLFHDEEEFEDACPIIEEQFLLWDIADCLAEHVGDLEVQKLTSDFLDQLEGLCDRLDDETAERLGRDATNPKSN
ncbi:hypothetical protein HZC53_04780 [Candidatus Uhrbacteria bacterium]|nr:hypothetical protein [Candidatus Uhrbacteria bacterium]